MSLDKKIKDYKEAIKMIPNEQKIKDTVIKSIDAFYIVQQQKMLTYWEFLWTQLKLIQKRWWFFQLLLLVVLWFMMPFMKAEQYMPKTLGVIDSEYRNLLGYLPQDFGFYPDFTVNDYLLYIATIKGIRPAVAKKKTKELISKVGLTNVTNKKMKKLSGGMKRRVGIAQAMLNDPKILILDEPTAGLDPNERIRFRNLISELSKDRLVLLSTHIVSDIEYIANEIWLMKDEYLDVFMSHSVCNRNSRKSEIYQK